MANIWLDLFSKEDVEYLTQHPETIKAKTDLETSNKVKFTLPLNPSIISTLKSKLGLDLSSVTEVPMRWIKGDTPPHKDAGPTAFENTYLVYLNNSPGEFIVDGSAYSITENTAFIFREGLLHETQNTLGQSRLLFGPMNEFGDPVGATITYYTNYDDAYAQNGNFIAQQAISWIIGDTTYMSGSIGDYTSWRVAAVPPEIAPTGVYSNGFDLSTIYNYLGFFIYPVIPCFLEGTHILALIDGAEKYVPVETLKKDDLIKTSLDGYKKIALIKSGDISNPGHDERVETRLYKCSPAKYPELSEDLYITGCHSILVGSLTEEERDQTIKSLGEVFITDDKYRLVAAIDKRAEPWVSEGVYKIWHLALENENEKFNYGIYANGGLLVETCSINFLKNHSNLQ
jgi:hypothetical protein